MSKTELLNIKLTDEMKEFVSNQTGSGTMFATPSECIEFN